MVAPLIAAAARVAAKQAAKQAAKSAAKSAAKQGAKAAAKKSQPLWRKAESARKLGKTKIANLQKELKSTTNNNVKAFIKQDIKLTQKAMQGTYKSQGMSESEIKSNISFLKSTSVSRTLFGGENRIQNYMTQKQLNLATKGQSVLDAASNPSIYSSAQAKVFYRATQKIWEGTTGNRNQDIMKYFGVKSLSEAVDIVLNSPNVQTALKIESGEYNPNAYLDEEQAAYYDDELMRDSEQQKQGSPDYLDYVVQFDVNEKWESGKQV